MPIFTFPSSGPGLRGPALQGIVPPHILRALALRGSQEQRELALRALTRSARLRERREIFSDLRGTTVPTGTKRRSVFDAGGGEELPGTLARDEGGAPCGDTAVDEAYDAAGATYDFYAQVYGRNSVDGRGLRLNSSVHYGERYDNAFWNGRQMVYGDGDGETFGRFTLSLDVVGHELTHGVTQFEANLNYQGQSGALNESVSDVFGSLVKQWKLRQSAGEADWLIGAGLFTARVHGAALRSMKAPGTSYDDPVLGKDPQPAHMQGYVQTDDDSGGVHINSGIPNHAFYLTASALGGYAWERAGHIWYVALCDRFRRTTDFAGAATLTSAVARDLYGAGSEEERAVREAWRAVGL